MVHALLKLRQAGTEVGADIGVVVTMTRKFAMGDISLAKASERDRASPCCDMKRDDDRGRSGGRDERVRKLRKARMGSMGRK